MSLLSDIYVARSTDAARYDTDRAAFADVVVQRTGLTELVLSTLWAILEDREWDAEMLSDFDNVMTDAGGRRLIAQLPQAFVDKLLGATAAQLDQAADRWSHTEEVRCEPREARVLLNDLIRLGRVARASGKSLYLWNCV